MTLFGYPTDGLMRHVSNLTGAYRDDTMVHDLQKISVKVDKITGYVQSCDLALTPDGDVAAPGLHGRYAVGWFKRSHEYCAARVADDVEAPMQSIRAVDV